VETESHAKPVALELEIEELEAACHPGCNTSTTRLLCTCPVSGSTAASLFTSKNSA
jgi:hypothetical protein